MAKGRKTGGRRPGSQNVRTRRREAAMREMAQAMADAIPDAFRGDAHMLLVAIYRDPRQPIELRLDAAKAAIRFEKPTLASTDVRATIRRTLADFTDEELAALAGADGGGGGAGEAPGGPH
jgi:hypothetical protein